MPRRRQRERDDQRPLLGQDPLPQRRHRLHSAADRRLPRRRQVHRLRGWTSAAPASSVCSSAGRTFAKAPVDSRFMMKVLTSSTVFASTLMFRRIPRSWSTRGRTDAIRTSSGSVVSNRLNSSVHENVRRSIRSLACRASAAAKSTCRGSTLARSCAACRRRSAARDFVVRRLRLQPGVAARVAQDARRR